MSIFNDLVPTGVQQVSFLKRRIIEDQGGKTGHKVTMTLTVILTMTLTVILTVTVTVILTVTMNLHR